MENQFSLVKQGLSCLEDSARVTHDLDLTLMETVSKGSFCYRSNFAIADYVLAYSSAWKMVFVVLLLQD